MRKNSGARRRERTDGVMKNTTDTFNKKLLIETRRIRGTTKEILHMTDMWSRLTISVVIDRCMGVEYVGLTSWMRRPAPHETEDEGHRLIDRMVRRMSEEFPDFPVEMRFKWGYLGTYDHHGYTPNQLVYGDTPRSRGPPPTRAQECEGRDESPHGRLVVNETHL